MLMVVGKFYFWGHANIGQQKTVTIKLTDTLKVTFYPRKDRGGASSGKPIYMSASLSGTRVVICSTGVRLLKSDKWNKELSRIAGTSKRAMQSNKQLDIYEAGIRLTLAQNQSKQLTIGQLKTLFLAECGLSDKKSMSFFDFADIYLSERKSQIGISIGKATYNRYVLVASLFKEFLVYRLSMDDIHFSKMDALLVAEFEKFLIQVKHYDQQNTLMKKMSHLRTIVNEAIRRKITDNNPFYGYKISYKDVRRDYLTEAEVKKLIRKKLDCVRLEQIRDVFVFSCFTGVSFCDIERLRPEDILEVDGESWLVLPRGKTHNIFNVPLTSVPMTIIGKYRLTVKERKGKLLPIASNQRTNAYLKELADLCGIHKRLTFHMARHTFSTMAINNGMPITTLQAILGHSNIKTTMNYIEVLDPTLLSDMQRLETKIRKKRVTNPTNKRKKK